MAPAGTGTPEKPELPKAIPEDIKQVMQQLEIGYLGDGWYHQTVFKSGGADTRTRRRITSDV